MEIDYNAVFGLDEGANETETADPSPAVEAEETAENEVVETEEEASEEQEEETEETEGARESDPAAQTEQTKEERAKYANIRRRAQEEAEKNLQQKMDAKIAALGMVNNFTGKPITTEAEMREFSQCSQQENHNQLREKTGLSDDEITQFVDSIPEVREARQVKADLERQRRETAISDQIKEITALDPTIKSLNDLMAQDNYSEIYAKVQKGYSIPDAYRLVNYDKLTAKSAAAAKQEALNKSAGKSHMTTTTQRGQGAMTVPTEVVELYLQLDPTMTMAEINSHYNTHHKKG